MRRFLLALGLLLLSVPSYATVIHYGAVEYGELTDCSAGPVGYSAAIAAPWSCWSLDSIGNTQGNILYRGASNWSALATGTSGQFLETQGASANPAWASIPHTYSVIWCATCTVAADTLPVFVSRSTGTIASITYYTNGSGTPSFTVNVQIGGVSMSGCNSISVSSSTANTTTCTGSNTFTSGQKITAVLSSISGVPNDALVQLNVTIP